MYCKILTVGRLTQKVYASAEGRGRRRSQGRIRKSELTAELFGVFSILEKEIMKSTEGNGEKRFSNLIEKAVGRKHLAVEGVSPLCKVTIFIDFTRSSRICIESGDTYA